LSATVPRPLVVGSLDRPAGWPFMAYLKIEGTPLANLFSLSRTDRDRLVEFLTRLLRELSEVPLGPLRSLGIEAGDASSWATRYRRLLRRYSRVGAKHVRSRLDDAIRRRFREFFLALEDSRYRPVLSHGDLWPSHVLWNDRLRRPVAVIDWEDARLGDPAFDLTAFADLGPEAGSRLASVRESPRDSRFVERLLFYRRILPLPGLLYGIETGRRSLARQHLAQLSRSLELENTG
jgi:aminoglycoside phosphotransferase (APT) family kinase protein